ncbi:MULTISPECIES: HDOD domain-containing protein [Thalassotalea]|uniref:HDOD domain-containing protein n=1 Tax=Thalassotalea castellviae TaxID=3075612 RepID=A0ABU3A3Z4_9GAMM|nr:HDOD domain-containing protein [Thalassotalea sp. W431]MDT0604898.1 HDOD domain-containing protein [Thalassotalea sp. W431]
MSLTAHEYAIKAQQLCVLPDIYLKLKDMLADESTTLADISALLSLEPALASSLLKIANSALFNFPKEIDSIDRALMILGIKEVQTLIDTYGVTAAFSGLDPTILDMDKFWEISVDCALLTKFLAKKIKLENADSMFLSGLLHNIGELAIVHTSPKKVQYCEGYDREETPWDRQIDTFGFTFSQCSAELLSLWQLPTSIIEPIALYKDAYNEDLDKKSTLLFITTRLALINSHPGMYSKKTFLGQHLLEDLSLTLDDIDQALEFCNVEGMAIMSSLNVI